jgi:hypothetical protein
MKPNSGNAATEPDRSTAIVVARDQSNWRMKNSG